MIKIGVICPSEIAFRRFMPALSKIPDYQFIGIGVNSFEERFLIDNFSATEEQKRVISTDYDKAEKFVRIYGGKIFPSYTEIINEKQIDAIYIPLPPALHYLWAEKALKKGKHVLVEKPAVLTRKEAERLTSLAADRGLALHENYMFVFHSQLAAIQEYIKAGNIGDIRLIRIAFGFPKRALNDFRYDSKLGGGALIDCGGYTIKYASMLLGDSAKIVHAAKNSIGGFNVDMYGSGVMMNEKGLTAHISFGMDNDYKCELEVWGSKGTLYTNRILTAPVGFIPQMKVRFNGKEETIALPEDDSFRKSLLHFLFCIENKTARKETYNGLVRQAEFIDEFNRMACKKT